MQETEPQLRMDTELFNSHFLSREVTMDFYVPEGWDVQSERLALLLIPDGQDLRTIHFRTLAGSLMASGEVEPLFCVGIHANEDRKMEYGTAGQPDYEGRGARAGLFTRFVLEELLPEVYRRYGLSPDAPKAAAGFSLGGLMALDIVWNHPGLFSRAGIFSGALWWRTKALDAGYRDETDRIMHARIRDGSFNPGLQFFFTTGSLDEAADRNNNGVIDSIDDTLDLIGELKQKGYTDADIRYINYEDGGHNLETWARGLTPFLKWGWGGSKKSKVKSQKQKVASLRLRVKRFSRRRKEFIQTTSK